MSEVSPLFDIDFSAMSSRCDIRLSATDEAAAFRLTQYVIDEVRRIEVKYSRYRADSFLSHINAAAGKDWVECDAESFALFQYAESLFQASGGMFDITSGILRRAWNFRQPRIPSEDELKSLLPLIGWQTVQWQHEQGRHYIRLPQAGMEIDFGGFGKEYAVDRAAAILIEQGVQHGYVNLGGDIRVMGSQPDGQPWLFGIQNPRNTDHIIGNIPIKSGALTTSGDYERSFTIDGKRYCHILDPRSGMPVDVWRSVTVLAPLAVAAGSYSTIAMLKADNGLEFLEESKLAYLAVDREGKVHLKNAVG